MLRAQTKLLEAGSRSDSRMWRAPASVDIAREPRSTGLHRGNGEGQHERNPIGRVNAPQEPRFDSSHITSRWRKQSFRRVKALFLPSRPEMLSNLTLRNWRDLLHVRLLLPHGIEAAGFRGLRDRSRCLCCGSLPGSFVRMLFFGNLLSRYFRMCFRDSTR